tara:strand:+ start:2080 stop:2523 length:444 start_codon:yes stop_codon:yes gene_type:complete
MTKAERKILKYKQKNPKASLRQIGRETGFSHEYARLVLTKNNIDTRFEYPVKKPVFCLNESRGKVCGNPLSIRQIKTTKICSSCKYLSLRANITCPNCKKEFLLLKSSRRLKGKASVYCSHSCALTHRWNIQPKQSIISRSLKFIGY